ncbi:MAG TPA: fused MFS/spermidine synthase [Gemmatimonadales bacterium]|nr:fused MFS/spermidine synthase [Gemmatimonadales bacterium]
MRSSAARAYSLLFFLSGATGLVYELLWVRVLYQTFGSTIQSVTTVVAAYMGGLGLGAWLLGRRADHHPRPAALYGRLEIAIAAFGLASPLLLSVVHRAYVLTATALDLTGGPSVALRFGLAALVLLIPTTLMGGTLPVLTRAFMGAERDRLRPSLGWLYGLNTLGAVAGTALAGFVLIEHVGIRVSLWGTAAVNLALGAAALALARPLDPNPAPSPTAAWPAPHAAGTRQDGARRVALVLLALTAFASLLDEIAWTRVLVMIVGGSTYAFTLVLLMFLLGIGLGSALVARRSQSLSVSAAYAALAQGLTGAGAALLLVFFGALPVYMLAVFQHPGWGAGTRLALSGLAVSAVVLVPAIGMGLSFPLLADLAAPRDVARGADVGRAYALNTLGSIAGAVLTGFVLVVAFGTESTLRLGLVVNGAAALALAALAARGVPEGSAEHRALRPRVVGAGALASVALGVAFGAPGWSTRLIDLAPTIYGRQSMDSVARRAFLAHRGVRQLAFREGRNATVSVWEGLSGRTLRVNGKVDASDQGDMNTQIMLGVAPAAARPDPASALVIGYGSGVTTRVLADVPGMRRVRVVEIEPTVLEMSRFFAAVNDDVLARSGVSVIVDDARSALQLHRDRFDVIVSEPSNPWVAGVATLYTPEFFRIVRARLSDEGVFCQWVQLYQLPLPIVAGIVRNLRAVFPHVEVWFSSNLDLLVLGSARPLRYDRAWLGRLLAPATGVGALGREWLGIDSVGDYFGRRLLVERGAAALAARATLVHEDDRPELEFVAARRFLDPLWDPFVFDSLIAIGERAGESPGTTPVLLARAMTAPRGPSTQAAILAAAHRAQPANPVWMVRLARMRFAAGDTAFADSVIRGLLARSHHPEALLFASALAGRRGDDRRRAALLREVVARGGDTAEAEAGLAALAARAGHWSEAVVALRLALAGGRATYRHPFPAATLHDPLVALALTGPPRLADSVLAVAARTHPGWTTVYELRGAAALRDGRCDDAAAQFLALADFGIEVADAPERLVRCRRGETR